MLRKVLLLSLFIGSLFSMTVHAMEEGGGGSEGAIDAVVKIPNPLQIGSVQEFVTVLLRLAKAIGWSLLVLMVVYAGFTYITAMGNGEKISKAHKMLWWTLIGGAILLGAEAIALLIENTVELLEAT